VLAAVLGILFQNSRILNAQDKPTVTFGGYVDAYYSYDNDKNGNLLRQFSSISPNREEFRLNIAQVNGSYLASNVRASLSVQYGDIPAANWPSSMQFIQQANAGFSPVKNLWIDAGYFLTHIGAEGLLPKDNFLSSHALATYFEPFYQSGVKISYDFSPKFTACIHLLNGYNVLADNNKNKSAGITLDFKPNSKSEIIYNNLFGNEQPAGSESKVRIYNNLVFKYSLTKKLDFLAGIDYAMQEKSKIADSTSSASVFSGLAALRYKFSKKFSASIRGEMFSDENAMLSGIYADSDGKSTGLKASGVTLGLEYKPAENVFVRIETRYLNADSKLKIFYNASTSRVEATLNMSVWF
jgi:opacity protein-like surface antigen